MKSYNILVTQTAKNDIDELYYFIITEYKSLGTALKYIDGIKATINKLSLFAESFRVQNNPSLSQYGPYLRRINYKKMAILYSIYGETVYIHRIIPGATILSFK